ncbi:SDR family NAD(P)-dependent oxidoreductase [Kutzneria sp. CA-103260]|uniref:SDR family NAD(P)-dependent oxidoreductase n=1 Tax=Kutzneria sp. CA-103260 TaxID=2802641 RepID=UPI001BA8567B|nr:SDR family NAD(P)-dependent oxidoreductase [Kutzneria sp. CA-103260]QUQ64725.1 SDR family oxidoreductase [Kutzneria sp. CA-103260]
MTTILITGANKGLGLEAARQLVAAGHKVWLGSRDVERGRRAAEEVGGTAVQLDVTDDASVAAAAEAVAAAGGLDVLVNNAGIQAEITAKGVTAGPAELTAEMMRTTLDTNVVGTVRVLHAFLPLLQRSEAPVVVNVSSGLASLSGISKHDTLLVAYPTSKVAVNMVTVQFAKAFPGMRINSVEPGYTATDLNHHKGFQSVEQGAKVIVEAALLGPDGPTGEYFDANGTIPW